LVRRAGAKFCASNRAEDALVLGVDRAVPIEIKVREWRARSGKRVCIKKREATVAVDVKLVFKELESEYGQVGGADRPRKCYAAIPRQINRVEAQKRRRQGARVEDGCTGGGG